MLHTKLSAEECVRELQRTVGRLSLLSLDAMDLRSVEDARRLPVVGKVDAKRNKFIIRMPCGFGRWSAVARPVCWGRLLPEAKGTNIHIRFLLHPVMRFLMGFYIAVVALLLIADSLPSWPSSTRWQLSWGGLMLAVMAMWGKKGEQAALRRFLEEVLKAKENGDRD